MIARSRRPTGVAGVPELPHVAGGEAARHALRDAWPFQRVAAGVSLLLNGADVVYAVWAAVESPPDLLIVIEPSPPAEIQGSRSHIEPGAGTFDPEDVYGPLPGWLRARPESLLARGERKRGVSVPRLACPTVVVFGADFAEERGRAVAERYSATPLGFPGIGHNQLIRDTAVRAALRPMLVS